MVAFYDEMTSFVREVSAVPVFYLGFSKAFVTVSHKWMMNGLDKWTLMTTENWMNYWAKGVVPSSTNFSCGPVAGSVPQGLILD